eukprot:24335-Rhodomonas_salina.1
MTGAHCHMWKTGAHLRTTVVRTVVSDKCVRCRSSACAGCRTGESTLAHYERQVQTDTGKQRPGSGCNSKGSGRGSQGSRRGSQRSGRGSQG